MRTTLLLLATMALASCAGTADERPRADMYDRIHMLMVLHDSALNGRDYEGQARTEVEIRSLANRNFKMLSDDCAEAQDPRIRTLAVFALGFSRHPDAATALRLRLDDPDPEVRVQAAVGIGMLKPPDPPIERLKRMLDEPDERIRLAALVGLKMLLAPGQDGGLGQRLVDLLDDPDQKIRNEVVLLMGSVRAPEFLQPLARKGLQDRWFLTRLNAALTIAKYETAAGVVLPHLIETLKDADASVVEAAHWALKKVTGLSMDRSYDLWRNWYEEERLKYEYYCPNDPEVVRELAGTCPKCGTRLDRRIKPFTPKIAPPEEKKSEEKDDKK